MISTLYSTGQLNAPLGFAAALAIGALFGVCLERAGFGSSRRLSGVFYFTDMSVVKVMFSALVTAMLGLTTAERMGVIGPDVLYLMPTLLTAHAVGGAIFGLAFAMGGWCPGTAAVGVASGRIDALVFLAGVMLGSIAYNEAFPWIAPYAAKGDKGVVFLHQSLDMTKDQIVLGLTGAAVLLFWISEAVERGRAGVSKLFLAGFCALLCLGALFALNAPKLDTAGLSAFTARPGLGLSTAAPGQAIPGQTAAGKAESPETAILAAAQTGQDHMEPGELARRLMASDPSVTLVDIRSKAEFDTFHLKGAANIPMERLPEALAGKRGQGIIVLYSNGMTHPAQARDALARLGFGNVYILTGGLKGFFEEVLKPAALRAGPVTVEQAAAIESARKFFLPPSLSSPSAPGLLTAPGALPGLVEASWLAANLGKPGLKVIDLRAQPQYNSGHIPGSLSLNLESLRGNVGGLPSMLLPANLLAEHLGQMGVSPRDLVVIAYGEQPHDATLMAMALERLGHKRYAVLAGGMKAWLAAALPTGKNLPKAQAVRYPVPAGQDGFTVTGQEVFAAMTGGKTLIIDVRPADYYAGTKSDEARAGHIPNAVNRPFSDDQTKGPGDSTALKPLAELEKAYAAVIPSKDHPVIVHCRTGHQASQTWWILSRLLGYGNVKYYDAGWTEWAARPEWPAVVSPPPGEPRKEAKP
jgi:thiosulfate/3-mercaptopyruvate sulfurtransferase